MKRIVLCILIVFSFSCVMSQTNFRNLTYEQAVSAAKAENKLLFLDFYTVWCGPCKMMAKEVFPLKAVGDYMNERFVCIQLDAEKEGKDLGQQFKVMFYPTFIALDTTGKEVLRIEGGTDAETFLVDIDRRINPEKTPERLKERYEAGERTAELVQLYAALKMSEARKGRQGDPVKKKEAFQIVRDYFNGLKNDERLKAENLFIYTDYTESPLDEFAKYMVENEKHFAPSERERINACIADLYERYLTGYFSGKISFNQNDYEQIKRDVNDLGLNKDKRYDLMFRFIECHATGNLIAYLDLFEKEYEHLSERDNAALIHGFPLLMNTNDSTVVRRALQMVRDRLAVMPLRTLLGVSDVVYVLENKVQGKIN